MSAVTTDFTRRISESQCGHVKSGVGLEICKEKETRAQIIKGTRESACDARYNPDTFPSDLHHNS
jgi:hypothetical protein